VSSEPGNDAGFGLLLPTSDAELVGYDRPMSRLVDLARQAAAAGCSSVWAGESMQSARLEPLAVLAAVGTAVDELTLGTAAVNPVYRQPVATAQAVATLDRLLAGRLILGVGSGFPMPSTAAAMAIAGVSYPRRAQILDDIVGLWRQMWTDHATTFRGRMLAYDDLPPAHAHGEGGPPILLAGGSAAALARAAELCDGWLPYPPDPLDYARGLATIRAHQPETRSAVPFTAAMFVTVLLEDDDTVATETLNEFCRATYGLPLAAVNSIQAIVHGPPEDVARGLSAYRDAGATDFVVRVGSVHVDATVDRLGELVDAVQAMPEKVT
jgi:alkanesulfonate monooxygenase SsuD/methylene tetrahydromethanopterin reductase-like flavin-dependent oxidoreductase (luciferase family)